MIKNLRHTGIVVQDLKRATAFYRGLGFKVSKKDTECGHYIDTVTGIKNVNISWVKMNTPNGDLIELLQYISHPSKRKRFKQKANQLGCSHVAVTTNNIKKICNKIKKMGGTIINEPIVNPQGNVKVVYCHDLEGVIIEIVEELN